MLLNLQDTENLFTVYIYLISCSIILYKTSYSLSFSLAIFQAIRLLLNPWQLHMKSTKALTVIDHAI